MLFSIAANPRLGFRLPRLQIRILAICVMAFSGSATQGADTWFAVKQNDLQLLDGGEFQSTNRPNIPLMSLAFRREMRPRIILDGPGKAFLGSAVGMGKIRFYGSRIKHDSNTIVVQAPAGKDVTGRLLVPNFDWTGMYELKFRIPHTLGNIANRKAFLKTQHYWYESLQEFRVPGSAWFRHLARETATLRNVKPETGLFAQAHFNADHLYSGTRAISENLSLDRVLQQPTDVVLNIDAGTIQGITTKEFEWDKMKPDKKPVADPLARMLPHNQYAVFFRDFGRFATLMDEVGKNGAPFIDSVSSSIQDEDTLGMYENQLCLSMGNAARLIGQHVVKSVAITGSDLYLSGGSELTFLLETDAPAILYAAIVAKQNEVAANTPNAERREGKSADVAWTALVSPDRSVSSYVAKIDDAKSGMRAVLITNSENQIRHLARIRAGNLRPMSDLGEYKHFRGRYQRDDADETAFIMLTDATIRDWCGPLDRIAATRRIYAGALLAEETARHMDELVRGVKQPRVIKSDMFVPNLGQLMLTKDGVTDSRYGNLEFMTPIDQLKPLQVSKQESDAYTTWRSGYERNFRKAFDPIGVSISVAEKELAMDMTVMPLMAQSNYRWIMNLVNDRKIRPDAGERHPANIFNLTLPSSPAIYVTQLLAQENAKPLQAMLGESMSVYLDDDPFWVELIESGDDFGFLMTNMDRLPVVLRIDLQNATKFLDTLAAQLEKKMRSPITFVAKEHAGVTWYQSVPPKNGDNLFGVYSNLRFVILPNENELHLSLSKKMIHDAIDRYNARQTAVKNGQPFPVHGSSWLGESTGLQLRIPPAVLKALGPNINRNLAAKSFAGLHILNEWKSRYGSQDPVGLHERIWKTRPRCAGGGEYVWNEQFKTYESTVFGHPAAPKIPKDAVNLNWINGYESGSFGLTFEKDGLRARAKIVRK